MVLQVKYEIREKKNILYVRSRLDRGQSNVGGLAVGASDLVNCSLSVVGFIPVLNVGQQVS